MMWENHKAILLIVATVLYLVSMGLLFWRYRISLKQLGKRLEECQAAEEAHKKAEEQDAAEASEPCVDYGQT